jgi:hypothetical protein
MPEAKKSPAKAGNPKVKKTDTPKTPKADKPKVAVPKVDMGAIYESTGAYNPKATHNIKSMAEVEAVLPATCKEIQEAIPKHTDFVGYLIRRGGLAPQ